MFFYRSPGRILYYATCGAGKEYSIMPHVGQEKNMVVCHMWDRKTCRVRHIPKKKTDIKLNTLKYSYNRLLMTIDRPLLHGGGGALTSVPVLPFSCLLANYFMGLVN